MLKDTLRHTHFPYCLDRQPDGSYVMLNRNYKPVGLMVDGFVNYADHPVSVRLQGLTPAIAAKIDARGRDSLDRIYLYNDGCTPDMGKQHAEAYLMRLALVMNLRIADADELH